VLFYFIGFRELSPTLAGFLNDLSGGTGEIEKRKERREKERRVYVNSDFN